MVDANLPYSRRRYKLSLFGTNLLNEVAEGISGPALFIPNGTFSVLNKGRVFGVEL